MNHVGLVSVVLAGVGGKTHPVSCHFDTLRIVQNPQYRLVLPLTKRYVSTMSTLQELVVPETMPRRSGRRRSADAEQQILAATRELLATGGVRTLTMEKVALRAGVAKTTVYRRYSSRDDLALAVLVDMVRTVAAVPDLNDTRDELVHFLRATITVLGQTLMGRVMQGLVSELATNERLSSAFRERVVALRVAELRRLVDRGVERGELREDLDLALVHELLFGPIYYRLLLSGAPMDPAIAERLVDAVLPSMLVRAAGPAPERRRPTGAARAPA
jgi:AcrR family transcriptional regulator